MCTYLRRMFKKHKKKLMTDVERKSESGFVIHCRKVNIEHINSFHLSLLDKERQTIIDVVTVWRKRIGKKDIGV